MPRATAKHSPLDALTGLPGTAACRERLSEHSDGSGMSLGLIDLDSFGKVNAELGKDEGDRLIARVAQHLAGAFDGAGEVYRFGGDAIMVLLPNVEKEQAFLQLEEARKSFDGVNQGRLTFSGGVAAIPDDGSDPDTLVRKCSEALYRAKLTGRNRICLAREEKMVTKTVHYRQGQLEGIARLAKREGMNEASLLREALDDLLRKYNA